VAAGGVTGISAEVPVVVSPTGFAPPTAMTAIDPLDDADNNRSVLFIPNVGVNGEATNPTIDLISTGSTAGVTYLWRQTAGPTAQVVGTNTATLSVTPLLSRVYSFELTVTDANNLTASSTITFAVDTFDPILNPTGNAVPQASATGSAGQAEVNAQTGVGLSLSGSVLDANNPANTNFIYLWVQISGPPVVLNLTNPASPTFVPTVPGVYIFQLFVDDGNDISLPSEVSVNVTNLPPAAPGPVAGATGSSGCSISTGSNGLLAVLGLLALAAAAISLRRRNA
jgi:MYXO-CTERM domain-containing protein